MFKDLLVPITRLGDDQAAVEVAVALAEREGSHLTALVQVQVPVPDATVWGFYPATLYTGLYEEARKFAEQQRDLLAARLAKTAITSEVRVVESILLKDSQTAALHARYVDLVVLGRPAPEETNRLLDQQFSDLLRSGGRPVLAIPSGTTEFSTARRIAIGWQPSREASRAVHDAMPFLHRAQAIEIIVLDPRLGEGQHGQQPGADIATHLARHGLAVNVHVESGQGMSVGRGLLQHAGQLACDLLVIGGYSHSRLREQILGGVTQEVFNSATIPVLFSH